MTRPHVVDCAVVGGGPAGLSAALVLGRCTRRVLLCDDRRYRNDAAVVVNGYLTRDGTPPAVLRRLGRAELRHYGVDMCFERVEQAEHSDDGFCLRLADGAEVRARAVILATGLVDVLPDLPGLREHFGVTIHHCPYCDAWEHRGKPLAVHGQGGEQLAYTLRTWSEDVVLFSEGPVEEPARLAAAGVRVFEERVASFVGAHGPDRPVLPSLAMPEVSLTRSHQLGLEVKVNVFLQEFKQ